jgi:hypothetical protein
LVFNTFGGSLPAQFESRDYAARQGMQRYVTAASSQIVADQLQSRLGIHQRWQTKRGVAGRERIADVVEFDVDAIYFAKSERDNFGEDFGGLNYEFRYHVGDRVTLLSDGYYDMFDRGLQATSIGTLISRPLRGDFYVGLTNLDGPVSAKLLTSTLTYRMNDKWAAVGSSVYDFGPTGSNGHTIGLTRIGESFLFRTMCRCNLLSNHDFYRREDLGLSEAKPFRQRDSLGSSSEPSTRSRRVLLFGCATAIVHG